MDVERERLIDSAALLYRNASSHSGCERGKTRRGCGADESIEMLIK